MSFRTPLAMALASALLLLSLLSTPAFAQSNCESKRVEHKTTFLSPGLTLRPGDVKNKFFEIDTPAAAFATVNFDAELVDEHGESVPLSEVYLHHWVIVETAVPVGYGKLNDRELKEMMSMNPANVYQGGVGEDRQRLILNQAWAVGGETRHLNSTIPAPYGMTTSVVPEGYRSQWLLNLHGIDTRGALHRMACTECRCDLFTGWNHTDVPENYLGGLKCCEDETRCLLRDDFNGDDKTLERTIHLKYTWTYVEPDECVVLVKQTGIDVTASKDHRGTVEYTVEGHCDAKDFHKPECVDVHETTMEAKWGGDIVYAVSHLHAYSLDSSLWGEDGRLICHSSPMYGHGSAAGDEKGYVVGIRHCIPAFNGVGKVKKGEKLRYQVKYTKVDGPHTGVMGVMFYKVAIQDEGGDEVLTPVVVRGSVNRKIMV